MYFLGGTRYVDEMSVQIRRADIVCEIHIIQVAAFVTSVVDFPLVVEVNIDVDSTFMSVRRQKSSINR